MASDAHIFDNISLSIKNNEINEPTLINIAANLYNIIKTTAADRQWFTKNVANNKEFLDMSKTFIEYILIPQVTDVPGLNGLDLTQSVSTLINTHHKMLRDALQIFLISLFEKAKGFSFSFEKNDIRDFKRLIFYLAHTLELEPTNQNLTDLLQEINHSVSQSLYFSSVYLLINQEALSKLSRLQLEWIASRFAEKSTAQAIEHTIGSWTRRLLINALLLKAAELPQEEPKNEIDQELAQEILFVPNNQQQQASA